MVGADSVTISAKRSAHPSSDPPTVEKDEFSTAVEKAATLEMEGRKMRMRSRRKFEDGPKILLPHYQVVYMRRKRVGRLKVNSKVRVEAGAEGEMLENRY